MGTDGRDRTKIIVSVIVAALGYFVDIYDLVLFSIVRIPSLKALGFEGEKLLEYGVFLLNMQMIGMLLGGILWGVIGDKKGRLSVLFGSIFLYSIANIANAFVTSIEAYGLWRFLAGVGLAGELGAAITLIAEIMPKETRGYGTAVVASVGVSGAVAAALIGDFFQWKTAYIVGGSLGLLLLTLRISMFESGMFSAVKEKQVRRGDLRMLLFDNQRLFKYLRCILIGVPVWYVVGVLVTFSPELGRELGVTGEVSAGYAIMMAYIGLVFGDFASGIGSQLLRTRKKVVLLFLILTAMFVAVFLNLRGAGLTAIYAGCVAMGFAIGYWAVFVTVASEQFGTNLRATVTTTAPNFVRGAVVPLTTAFQVLTTKMSLVQSAALLGVICIGAALLALRGLEETFGKDLDYLER